MTVYKAGPKPTFNYILGAVALLAIGIPLFLKFSVSGLVWLGILLLVFIVINVANLRLYEIQLDQASDSLILKFRSYIGINKVFIYSLKQIEFTYKEQATSFRGGVKDVCAIYYSSKKVGQLIPGNDDWTDEEITNFVLGLIGCNVKKKFTGDRLKDVEI